MLKKSLPVILFVGGIAVFIVIVAVVNTRSGSEQDTFVSREGSVYSQSNLSLEEDYYDFGTISMRDGKVTRDFTIENKGAEAVMIKKVTTSCMCTTALLIEGDGSSSGPFGMPGHGLVSKTNVEVLPGESVTVEAIFDPAAHGRSGVGVADRTIFLDTNSTKSPKVEISFRAIVTP